MKGQTLYDSTSVRYPEFTESSETESKIEVPRRQGGMRSYCLTETVSVWNVKKFWMGIMVMVANILNVLNANKLYI